MTNPGDVPELQELESIDGPAEPAAAPAPVSPSPVPMPGVGLPAPAYNPRADKFYYRFLFCGVLIVVGCLMPFGPQLDLLGFKTMSGGLFLVIGLGMIWTWWGAISMNRASGSNLKWIALCFVPFLVELMNLISAFDSAAVKDAIQGGAVIAKDWREVFSSIATSLGKSSDAAAAGLKVDNFFRSFGPGKIFVFLGAALAELFFLWSIFGATRKIKQDKIAKQAAAAERRRR
ncbi:MAG: hypothetical protein Fur0037_18540 [Planctomycetota bacterium]